MIKAKLSFFSELQIQKVMVPMVAKGTILLLGSVNFPMSVCLSYLQNFILLKSVWHIKSYRY